MERGDMELMLRILIIIIIAIVIFLLIYLPKKNCKFAMICSGLVVVLGFVGPYIVDYIGNFDKKEENLNTDNNYDDIDLNDEYESGYKEINAGINGNGNIHQNIIINNFNGENNNISETTISDYFLQDEKNTEENQMKKELVIDVDGEIIYPISIDIKDEQKVGEWTYFIYRLTEDDGNYTIEYPVLFRYKEDVCIAERVSPRACYSYDVAKDCVFI